MNLHMSVHVPIGGERLATHCTLVRPLARVHQHVTIQGAGRAQRLPTDTACVVSSSRVCVVLTDVHGQLVLGGANLFT